MNEVLLFSEIIIIFSLVVLSKKLFNKEGLLLWIGLASVLANLEVSKSINVFGINATLGNVLFASVFLATDIITECYGKDEAKKGVKIGLFSMIVYLITTQFAINFIPSEFDVVNESMINLFNIAPRICLSSVIMFYLSNVIDVYLYDKLLNKFKGNKMWLRNNMCTIFCNCLENFGFTILAFYNIFPTNEIMSIAIATSVIEIIIALCDTPFLYIAKKLKNKK